MVETTQVCTVTLAALFEGLSDLLCADYSIERNAQAELRAANTRARLPRDPVSLPSSFLEVMNRDDAHPVCHLISELPFHWAPPQTSSDPLYQEHSHFKAHVELLGPAGLVASSKVRIGLYGMMPHCEYGIRTHRPRKPT